MICDEHRKIAYLSKAKSERRHDKRLLDKTGIVCHIPKEVVLFADTGFQGLNKQHGNTLMPKKASRNKPLSHEQKQENKTISGIRILVEQAIWGHEAPRFYDATFAQ